MFALPEILGLLEDFALRPIRPCKTADHGHLVFAVYSHGVVRGRTSQSVTPDAFARVEVGSGVNGDIIAAHPQIHVELIGMRGAGGELGAAQDGAGVRVVEDIGAALGETLPHPSFGHPLLLGEGCNATKPINIFVPIAGFKHGVTGSDDGAQLQERTIVGEVAVIERED